MLHKNLNSNFPSLDELEMSDLMGIEYSDINSILLIAVDEQVGIKSCIYHQDERSPTGRLIVRDSTKATPFANRLPPNHPLYNSINLLQRTLETTRGLAHVMDDPDAIVNLRKLYITLFQDVMRLRRELLDIRDQIKQFDSDQNESITALKYREKVIKKRLESIEGNYNSDLCAIIRKYGLANNMSDTDCATLLTYVRYLAATLDNAPTVMTKYYQAEVQSQPVCITEIAYPVTRKTEAQKEALKVLSQVTPKQSKEQKKDSNFQTAQSEAIQRINKAFQNNIINDKTCLPAQIRKTIPHTVKNPFVVVNEIEVGNKVYRRIAIRCASPVYVGKGEDDASMQSAVEENIIQLENTLREILKNNLKLKLHFVVLNTNVRQENQDIIIKHMEMKVKEWNASNKKEHTELLYTNAPLNPIGICLPITQINVEDKGLDLQPAILRGNRQRRLDQILQIVLSDTSCFYIYFCASGQDRTGTTIEVMTEAELVELIQDNEIPIDFQDETDLHSFIQSIRGLSGIQSYMATVLVPGSPGMKLDSKPDNVFPKEIELELYRKSANTNKHTVLKQMKHGLFAANQRQINHRNRELLDFIEEEIKKSFSRAALFTVDGAALLTNGINIKKCMSKFAKDLSSQLQSETYSPEVLIYKIDEWKKSNVEGSELTGNDILKKHKNAKVFVDHLESIIKKDVRFSHATQHHNLSNDLGRPTVDQYKTSVKDYLIANTTEKKHFESTRINECLQLLLGNINAANHVVTCYILLKNSFDYIDHRRETGNLLLNKQIDRFQQLLQTLIESFDLSILTERLTESDQDASHACIKKQLKESRNLKLVEKLGVKYFSNKDFNDYICLTLDWIRKNVDGSIIIESKRINLVLDQAKESIQKTPSEVLSILRETLIILENNKVTFNKTLNSQIDYTMKMVTELIDFVTQVSVHAVDLTLPTIASSNIFYHENVATSESKITINGNQL